MRRSSSSGRTRTPCRRSPTRWCAPLIWMQDASPQQILATVPEQYLLGNKAMYLFAYNNVKTAYSKDGADSARPARRPRSRRWPRSTRPIKPGKRQPRRDLHQRVRRRRRSPSTARRSSAPACSAGGDPSARAGTHHLHLRRGGRGALHGGAGRHAGGRRRRVRLGGRPDRLRQVHAAQRRRRACSRRRAGTVRVFGEPLAGINRQRRLHVPGRGADALAHRARQRDRRPASSAASRATRRVRARRGLARARRPARASATAIRTSCRAACASAWRSRRR